MTRWILFVYDDLRRVNPRAARQLWLAIKVGFRTAIAGWQDITITDRGLFIKCGFEILDAGGKVSLDGAIINPVVVMHRKFMGPKAEVLFENIAHALPNCLLSYEGALKTLCSKWEVELAFRLGERSGIVVPRPPTYLVRKNDIYEALWPIGRTHNLIAKPVGSYECNGILISTPRTFENFCNQIRQAVWAQFVIQELLQSDVLLWRRNFDIRLYVLVTSVEPISFIVPRDGVVKIAGRPFHQSEVGDASLHLTGSNFRRSIGAPIWDVSLTRLLKELEASGLDTSSFWFRIDEMMRNVLRCWMLHPAFQKRPRHARSFFLCGLDILLVRHKGKLRPVFLEMNYAPSLNEWGKKIDKKLDAVHLEWISELAKIHAADKAAASFREVSFDI